MARSFRIALPGYPHHVIQRGNNRQAIFLSDEDYRFYLDCFRRAKEERRCRIYAYCLMSNHVHFLIEPSDSQCCRAWGGATCNISIGDTGEPEHCGKVDLEVR
jgi:putative transposase